MADSWLVSARMFSVESSHVRDHHHVFMFRVPCCALDYIFSQVSKATTTMEMNGLELDSSSIRKMINKNANEWVDENSSLS